MAKNSGTSSTGRSLSRIKVEKVEISDKVSVEEKVGLKRSMETLLSDVETNSVPTSSDKGFATEIRKFSKEDSSSFKLPFSLKSLLSDGSIILMIRSL